MEAGRNLHIRHAQTYRDKFEEGVYDVDHQRVNAGLCQLLWQMFRRCVEQVDDSSRGCSNASPRDPCSFDTGAVKSGYGTCRILVFTKRHEIQTGCPSEGFYIGNTNECHFMSSRLQPASECRHRIQVTDKGHTDKANLHTRFLICLNRLQVLQIVGSCQ